MKPSKQIEEEKQKVQDDQKNRNEGDGDGEGGKDSPPPPPPKVALKSKPNPRKKILEEPLQTGFLIPFPLHRCGWSPEGGTKRWCILNLVLVGIAIIISLANVFLVVSMSHKPEKHKLFMTFHPGVYWKCKKVNLTIDVSSTFVGEMVYVVACAFLLVSVLSKEANKKIMFAKFHLYISLLFPLGYLPRLFLLSNAPCKDPNAMINFGLIVVLFTLYLLLLLWLVVGNRLVRSYILWLRNPNAEEFFRDDDSEQVDIEEGNEPRQWRRLSNNAKKGKNILEFIIERKKAIKFKASSSSSKHSSTSSKVVITSVPLDFKISHTSLIEEIPSITPTKPLNAKEKENDGEKGKTEEKNENTEDKKEKTDDEKEKAEDKKKKTGFLGKIMGGLKNVTKKM